MALRWPARFGREPLTVIRGDGVWVCSPMCCALLAGGAWAEGATPQMRGRGRALCLSFCPIGSTACKFAEG